LPIGTLRGTALATRTYVALIERPKITEKGDYIMNSRTKILAIAIIAALVGGVVGAFAFRDSSSANSAAPVYTSTVPADSNATIAETGSAVTDPANPWGTNDVAVAGTESNNRTVASSAPVQVRTVTRTRYANSPSYVYAQPRQRTFWQKHRDKLTVAMGAGGGAILGALIGGKKGAAIGGLAGAGGSALYTYKIRNRTRRY
jgi:hypothetical protein